MVNKLIFRTNLNSFEQKAVIMSCSVLVAGERNLREQHFRIKEGFDGICQMPVEGINSIDSKIALKCWLEDKLHTDDIESRVPIRTVSESERKYEFTFMSAKKKVALSFCNEYRNLSDDKFTILEQHSNGNSIIYVASGDKSETNGQYPEGLMKIQKRQGYCLLLNVDGADYSKAELTVVYYEKNADGVWEKVNIARDKLSKFDISDSSQIMYHNHSLSDMLKEKQLEFNKYKQAIIYQRELLKDESNSITNQRNLIMEYIKSDAVLSTYTVREYIDDGIRGTRFDREAFEEMMTQVKEGNIQVIITKDYSRLGRDYLEVGRYLEFVFPVLKVRYISVNDNYDSNNFTGATGGMEVAVKNVINMMYSRDASKKVRSARTTLAKAGKFIGPQAPYGYKRSESDKQKLVIDEEPAEVVRLIFEMAIDGKKYKQIARYLNANNIDTRVQYKEKHGKKWNHPRNYEIKQWSATAVMNILFNEIYTGTIVYGKTACNAQTGYKSKKMNPDNWIIVENCHEPIVSKQTFEKAHKVINKTTCNRTKEQGSYKKSIIICGCCGKGLVNSYGYYKCSCDYDPSKYNCRNVRMKTEEFEAGVMQYINTTAAGMLEHLQIYKKKRSSSVELQKEIDKLHQMKSKAEAKKFQLYDDYTKGIVQRDIMVSERTTLTERIGEIEIELHELESKIQLEQCINKAGEEETIELLSKMETFDLDLIRQVVKRITMYDDGNIQFEWNVDDFLQVK